MQENQTGLSVGRLFFLITVIIFAAVTFLPKAFTPVNPPAASAAGATSLPPSTTITGSVATPTYSETDLLSMASTAQASSPLDKVVTAMPLGPSHEGGRQVANARWLAGFPDVGVPKAVPEGAIKLPANFSHYDPSIADRINCYDPRKELPSWASDFPLVDKSRGWCWSGMRYGKRWEYYVGRAVACPTELPAGTLVYAFGREWVCEDTGGKIVVDEQGRYWIDYLIHDPPLRWGDDHDIYVVYPS